MFRRYWLSLLTVTLQILWLWNCVLIPVFVVHRDFPRAGESESLSVFFVLSIPLLILVIRYEANQPDPKPSRASASVLDKAAKSLGETVEDQQ